MIMDEIKFYQTWDDHKALERYNFIHGSRRFYFFSWTIVLPIIIVGVPLFLGWWEQDYSMVLRNWWGFVIPIFIALFFVALLRWATYKDIKKSGLFDHEVVMMLMKEGLWGRGHRGESTTYWWSISKIVDYRDRYFFFLSGVSDNEAFVIPKSAFSTQEEGKKFYEEALKLWKQAEPRALGSRL